MKTVIAFVLLCGLASARPMVPPSSITLTMNSLTGFDGGHNGVFTLTGVNNLNGVGDPWFYTWQDRPVNPTKQWSIRITSDDHIEVGAGTGQFGVWAGTTDGNILLINSVPAAKPFSNNVLIKANP